MLVAPWEGSVKRRRTTTRKPAKTHRGTTKPRRNKAPTAAHQRSPSIADLQEELDARTRELTEAIERENATVKDCASFRLHQASWNPSFGPCSKTPVNSEITSPEKFKGWRFRMAEPGAEVLRRLGAIVAPYRQPSRTGAQFRRHRIWQIEGALALQMARTHSPLISVLARFWGGQGAKPSRPRRVMTANFADQRRESSIELVIIAGVRQTDVLPSRARISVTCVSASGLRSRMVKRALGAP